MYSEPEREFTFAKNRQHVVTDCVLSISSGVIQGNVLRPLLFLLYVNDVTDISMVTVYLNYTPTTLKCTLF